MIILSAAEIRQALPMSEAIEGMKQAFAAFSAGHVTMPTRLHLPVPEQNAVTLFMPAYLPETALAIKVVSVFPNNPQNDLDLIQAAVLVLDPQSGRPVALLEGKSLTAIRTGAASGAAIDLLANPNSRVLAIFGAGAQAQAQIEAACTVRPVERIWLYDPDRQKAEKLAQQLAGRPPVPADVRLASSPQQAVAAADIICTATTAQAPVFSDEALKPGVHISAIGAYRPDMREIPAETLARAQIYVDSRQAAQKEAGDLLFAQERSLLQIAALPELGELIAGRAPGRSNAHSITVFKSVGIAIQDAVAAQIALRNAEAQRLGQNISF